jgi:hypothetical protein
MQMNMRVEGILLPSDWDDNGRVIALVLATSDEGEFQVECLQPSIRLKKYLRKKVIVDGKLTGSSLLRVKTIKVSDPDRSLVGHGFHGPDRVR